MASRPILSPFQVITNGNMSANIASAITVIQNVSKVSYDISWTGTSPVGTMSVQVSNTYSQNADGSVKNPGNWTTVPLSGSTAGVTPVTGNSGNGYIEVDVNAYAIQLVYNSTSGIGTMNATITGKVS